MKKVKKDRLEAAGWRVGSTADFLRLSPDEVAFIEMKLALAKMEAADASVSLDLLIRALLVLGASRREVAHIIALESKNAA